MNEQDWLSPKRTGAPYQMFDYLRQRGVARKSGGRRKLRLLACACCRWVWGLLELGHRQAVEAAERLADQAIGQRELAATLADARQAAPAEPGYNAWVAARAAEASARSNAAEAAREGLRRSFDAWARDPQTPGALDKARWAEAEVFQCGLIRDLFGNPFRRSLTVNAAWLTAEVVALARHAYGDRDFAALPVLADALEEAGCTNEELLSHCQGPGPHARGCWILDLLLGKG